MGGLAGARIIACVFVTVCTGAASGQTPETAARFSGVEITASGPNSMADMRTRVYGGRYELRNATLTDLIRTAWDVSAASVVGGPNWLDVKRYDVTAIAPAGSSAESFRSMLRELLKERFQLAVHRGNRDVPAYVITAGRKPQLQRADGSEASGCAPEAAHPAPRGAPVTFTCRNMTMAAFAAALPRIREASGYVFNYPVLDRTGLTGAWNFRVTWSPRYVYVKLPAPGETITLSDALERQLGLKLRLAKTTMPVIVVDRAEPPAVVEAPPARFEFEVAEIKPEDPKHPTPGCSSVSVQPGGRVRIDMTLKGLIGEAWGDISHDRIIGPAALKSSTCWEVVAKAPVQPGGVAGWSGPVWNGLDIDSMRRMLRSLVIERFGLVAHMKETSVDGYYLLAAKPKLRRADPSNRPGCSEGPGPDGKDPRIRNPIASRLVTCRNMTLTQFAAEMNKDAFRSRPLVDMTGIEGRYDITLNFSPASVFGGMGSPDGNATGIDSTPDGAISIADAFRSQLGLRLEARRVTAPALVVEKVNETPTEN